MYPFINEKQPIIVAIDHGYGNIKTANCCFPTGIAGYDAEPLFTADMLVYEDRYYLIGEGHKEFLAEKTMDDVIETLGGESDDVWREFFDLMMGSYN